MGLDDMCNTTLVLGPGLSRKDNKPSLNNSGLKAVEDFKVCLSLGLCESYGDTKDGLEHRLLYRQESTSSSFCNDVALKREREIETERVSSRVSDESDDGSNSVTKKLRLNKDQSAVLEENFKLHSTLNPKQKEELARKLNLRARQVEVWFQNRRARTKLKQTEVDCEFLKICCESLKEENQRLHKELQELKALKLSQPLNMQMPAATLTLCPSCERISGSGDNRRPKTSLIMVSPKGHLVNNPITHPSAAC